MVSLSYNYGVGLMDSDLWSCNGEVAMVKLRCWSRSAAAQRLNAQGSGCIPCPMFAAYARSAATSLQWPWRMVGFSMTFLSCQLQGEVYSYLCGTLTTVKDDVCRAGASMPVLCSNSTIFEPGNSSVNQTRRTAADQFNARGRGGNPQTHTVCDHYDRSDAPGGQQQ